MENKKWIIFTCLVLLSITLFLGSYIYEYIEVTTPKAYTCIRYIDNNEATIEEVCKLMNY